MNKRFTFLLLAVFALFNTQAQEIYWPAGNEEINTGSNATYLVQSVSFDTENVFFGYLLGAFYTNDNGELSCGGVVSWGGVQTSISVFGDDSTTDEKDGFSEGEQITWLAYGSFADQTYNASVELGVGPTGPSSEIFSTNSINIISNFVIGSALETTVTGCINTLACNYNESAQEDDGSCNFPTGCETCSGESDGTGTIIDNDADDDGICDDDETAGCTDETAFNYNPNATEDDGSCVEIIEGCTDETAFNYNASANTDDGSCVAIVEGCIDTTAFNYNSNANTDDDSCLSEIEVVFEENATDNTINYNVSSETISLTLGNAEITEGDIIGGFYIVNGQLYCAGYTIWTGGDISLSIWIDDPNTTEIDGWLEGETIYWIAQQNNTAFNYLLELTSIEVNANIFVTQIVVNESIIIGCMDETAFNFNENAFINDGSCVPFIYDCTAIEACNYNPEANTDDGSCYYITATVSDLTYATPLSVTTDANSPTYVWYLNGELLTETGSQYTPYMNGEYMVTVTDDLGCEVSDTVTIDNVSLEELNAVQISTYPTPASTHIDIDAGEYTIQSIALFSMEGKLMNQFKVNSNQYKIARNNLANGIYLIELEINNKSIRKRIIFE